MSAKIVPLRKRVKPEIREPDPPDALSLATLYALRRDALDRGDLETAEAIDDEVQQLMERCPDD